MPATIHRLAALAAAAVAAASIAAAAQAGGVCNIRCQNCQSACYKVYEKQIFGRRVSPAERAIYKQRYMRCKSACRSR
jgi:hypothetical protein